MDSVNLKKKNLGSKSPPAAAIKVTVTGWYYNKEVSVNLLSLVSYIFTYPSHTSISADQSTVGRGVIAYTPSNPTRNKYSPQENHVITKKKKEKM